MDSLVKFDNTIEIFYELDKRSFNFDIYKLVFVAIFIPILLAIGQHTKSSKKIIEK
jgi:hypothetical protein